MVMPYVRQRLLWGFVGWPGFYERVMVRAQGDSVGQIGATTCPPRDDVVDVAGLRWPIASGERAALVAGEYGQTGGTGVEALFPTDIDRYAGAIEHHREGAGVTGDLSCLGGTDASAVFELG